MKNVLIISATDTIGGAEIVLYDFLKENRFHNFYILTSNNKNDRKRLQRCPWRQGFL